MRMFFLLGASCVFGAAAIAAAIPPPPALQNEKAFPEWLALADTPSAQRMIHPMDHTPKAQWAGGYALLPVCLSGNRDERASWDFSLHADLSLCSGIQFDFYCQSMDPFSTFSVYFQSGKGWYHASMEMDEAGKWQRVCIGKAGTGVEGSPEGWSKINAIRISGWRGENADTTCAIANLAPLGSNPEVLIIRADSLVAKIPSEATGFSSYARTLDSTLTALGLHTGLVSDNDVSPAMFGGARLVCLPYNPELTTNALSCLQAFMQKGGRMLVFYSLANGVGPLLGVKSAGSHREDDGFKGFAKTSRGLAGQPEFSPQGSTWTHSVAAADPAAPFRVAAVWRCRDDKDTDLPAISITPSGAFFGHVWQGGTEDPELALMRAVVGEIIPGFKARFEKAAQAAAEKTVADRQWLANIPARKGEHRAFWCHNPWGVSGWTWDEAIRHLKENGFNAIVVNLAWGDSASYKSSVLMPCPTMAKLGDALVPCLAACKKYGVQCNAWKVNWNTFSDRVPREALEALSKAGRVQVDFSGKEEREWLCPSNPQNQDQEVAAMAELADKGLDGIHFDYIRYPGRETCFCAGCRARFEKQVGHAVTNWPACTRHELEEAWTEFRCAQINTVVRRTAEIVHKAHPACMISAAVFSAWPGTRDSIGQDWGLWCQKGWLDAVCPMNYTQSVKSFANMVRHQRKVVGRAKFYPGIGLCSSSSKLDAVKVAQQILAAREVDADGFTIFNYDTSSVGALPLLHLGPTAE